MLAPGDRATAVLSGLRHLPHFVASAAAGADAEAADAALGAALAAWVRALMPEAAAEGAGAGAGAGAGGRSVLSLLNSWIEELQTRHPGAVIRALLQHPGASDVISALLLRGETEAAGAEALALAVGDGGAQADGAGAAAAEARADAARWRAVTDLLGRSFVEAAAEGEAA